MINQAVSSIWSKLAVGEIEEVFYSNIPPFGSLDCTLPLWRQHLSLDLLVIAGVTGGGLLRRKCCSPRALMGLLVPDGPRQASLWIACLVHTKHHSRVSPSGRLFPDSWNIIFMGKKIENKNQKHLASTDGHGHS